MKVGDLEKYFIKNGLEGKEGTCRWCLGVFKVVKLCYMMLQGDTSHHTFVQMPRVNPNMNCGHGGIMMSQYRSINCNKCNILVRDVDNES